MRETGQEAVDRERQSELFVLKAARSVAEIQAKADYVGDVSVMLEVLGYTKEDAVRNGFADLHDLARRIYDFIGVFDAPVVKSEGEQVAVSIPSAGRRVVEGLALSFGWLGSLFLLYMTGISLWLALGLQIKVTTLFMTGLFLGLFVTEGPLQSFNKLFPFYYEQSNMSEARRILKRHYALTLTIVSVAALALYGITVATKIPFGLFQIGLVSMLTVSINRACYAVVYSLKKIVHLVVSYSFAFVSLLAVYYLSGDLVPDPTTRYLVALVSAMGVLTSTALYDNFRVFRTSGPTKRKGKTPHFYVSYRHNANTIKSRFNIQLLETAPNYLFGTFLFSMMFSDRVIAWIFNPSKRANGVILPFVFNSTYHAGADLALLILFPVLIVQYVIMSPTFAQVINHTFASKVTTGVENINRFLQKRYILLLAVSLLLSSAAALALNYPLPEVAAYLALKPTSLKILRVASVANVMMSIFFVNSVFMMFMNRTKWLVALTFAGSLMVVAGGSYLAYYGFSNAVYAYLVASSVVTLLSTSYVLRNMGRAASIFFSRYA